LTIVTVFLGAVATAVKVKVGCDAVVLNASLKQIVVSASEREQLLVVLGLRC